MRGECTQLREDKHEHSIFVALRPAVPEASEAPQAQGPATQDHRGVLAGDPAHRQTLRWPHRRSHRAAAHRLFHRADGHALVECGQARSVRAEVLLRARAAPALGGTGADQAAARAAPARHRHRRGGPADHRRHPRGELPGVLLHPLQPGTAPGRRTAP
ncbi:MAG: hypothetical protein MZW92_15230 [Comamonadaceae bacterium]|nr:hypothetical protein [Comamonadaceae bacterium]